MLFRVQDCLLPSGKKDILEESEKEVKSGAQHSFPHIQRAGEQGARRESKAQS